MKSPAFNFYSSDFLTGTIFMTNEQKGAYITLMCYQHQYGHLTKEQIISVTNDQVVLSKFKIDSNGLYYNERLDNEIKRKTKYCESRANNRRKKDEEKQDISNTYEKDMKNICNSYEKHMENEIEIENIKEIINYLNKKIGSNYKYTTKATQTKIKARLNEGYKLDDFIAVIDKKVSEWKNTEFEQYLCPETLFGTKFEKYLNQKVVSKQSEKVPFWMHEETKEEEIELTDEQKREMSEFVKSVKGT